MMPSTLRPVSSLGAVVAPSELTGRSVEGIIDAWSAELEALCARFAAHGSQLEEWDRHVMQNR